MKKMRRTIAQRAAAFLLCLGLLLPNAGGAALAASPVAGEDPARAAVTAPEIATGETAAAGQEDSAPEATSTATPAPTAAPERTAPGATANMAAPLAAGDRLTISISSLTGPTYVVQNATHPEEGDWVNFQFQFDISCHELGGFKAGESIKVKTNLGDYFDADWDSTNFTNYKIYADDGKTLLATVSTDGKTVTFTIADGGAHSTSLLGVVTLPAALVARPQADVTPDKPQKKKIYVGEAKWDVEFRAKEEPEGQPGKPSLPDVDRFWKNYGNIRVNDAGTNGATAYIQVNPIGALDLYGSTTYDGPRGPRRPVQYTNYIVTDTVPAQAHIDPASIKIYAAINNIQKNTGDDFTDQYHGDELGGGYDIPKGTYFATRWENRKDIKDRMTQLTQAEGESYDQFYDRIKSAQLQWGVYVAADGTETFVCNLGNIGTEDNNGILYSDLDPDKVKKYPEIFGPEGASHGNVVSYYIEFNTYAPDKAFGKTTQMDVTNPGRWAADTAYREGHDDKTPAREGGNDATCTIYRQNTFAQADSDDLVLRLVDKDFPTQPISGASFDLCQQENGRWVPKFTKTTDANGYLTFSGLVPGKFKLRQTTTADGYKFDNSTDNSTYGSANTAGIKDVGQNGVFTVPEGNANGYGTIATNWRVQDIRVTTVWQDENDRDGLRPKEITVRLLANGQPEKEIQVTEEQGWSYTFEKLPRYENGR